MGCSCCKEEEEEESRKPFMIAAGEADVSVESFEVLKVIGRGNFGKVTLVKKIDNSKLYAMKSLKKKFIEERGQKIHTINERKIMESAKCPFIAKLYYAFQTPQKLYMVMEYLNGGELFFHLSVQKCFSEIRSRFYIAEMLLGLEYLHANGIIYRDLKPENVLLDEQGHIKLTDFGLSKLGTLSPNSKAYTFCGTPEYLAPEIIKGEGYNKAVDFWSLGALMYYMLSGAPPHYSKNKSLIYKNVTTKPVDALPKVSENANDLLLKLLKIDPELRICDASEIKKHAWFEGLNWEELQKRNVQPPYKPAVKNAEDTRNFDKVFTSEKLEETFESGNLVPATEFSGFTYKDPGSSRNDSSATK